MMNRSSRAAVLALLVASALFWYPASLSHAGGAPLAVPPGYRGVALPVQAYQLQFLEAGARIDVLTTFEAMLTDKRKEWVTATLLQNVLVLDVKAPACGTQDGAIQLALNPNEANYVSLAIQSKKIVSIALRGKGDLEMHPMEMASFRKLFR